MRNRQGIQTATQLRRACAAVALACAALATTPLRAAPEASQDAVARFLAERGLIEASLDTAPAAEPGLVAQIGSRASELVVAAMNFLGVPYRRGGTTAEGFDCSGFTRYVFEHSIGLALPRRVDQQAGAPGLQAVKRAELEPGDLVFFNTLRRTFSHVGIYVGDNRFIHAPRSGAKVRVEDMNSSYWAKRYTGGRRAALPADVAALPSPAPTAATP